MMITNIEIVVEIIIIIIKIIIMIVFSKYLRVDLIIVF